MVWFKLDLSDADPRDRIPGRVPSGGKLGARFAAALMHALMEAVLAGFLLSVIFPRTLIGWCKTSFFFSKLEELTVDLDLSNYVFCPRLLSLEMILGGHGSLGLGRRFSRRWSEKGGQGALL